MYAHLQLALYMNTHVNVVLVKIRPNVPKLTGTGLNFSSIVGACCHREKTPD